MSPPMPCQFIPSPSSKLFAPGSTLANFLNSGSFLFAHSVEAGFPSPADDYCEKKLDLNELLVPHPQSTFFLKAADNDMTNASIFCHDLLIVDRSLPAKQGSIIVVSYLNELLVRRLYKQKGRVFLMAQKRGEKVVFTEVLSASEWHIHGVVTSVVHGLRVN